jgi:hypothetical protein
VDTREVQIDCPRCGKPVSVATSIDCREWFLGGRADGGITPEGQLGGGLYNPDDKRPGWRSRLWDVSPEGRRAFDPAVAHAAERNSLRDSLRDGDERHKIVCNRRHRERRGRVTLIQRTITLETLNRVCEAEWQRSARPTVDEDGQRVMRARITLDYFR